MELTLKRGMVSHHYMGKGTLNFIIQILFHQPVKLHTTKTLYYKPMFNYANYPSAHFGRRFSFPWALPCVYTWRHTPVSRHW